MADPLRPFLNGRFLEVTTPTGVQRYAREVMGLGEFTVLRCPRLLGGRFTGQLWEQLWLPIRTFGRPLVSLCNSGPILKRKHLVVIHDLGPLVNPSGFTAMFRFKFRALVVPLGRNARVLVAVSETMGAELAQYFGRSDVQVVPNVVRPLSDHPVPPACALPSRFFLAVGASDPRKQVSQVAAAVLRHCPDDVGLVTVGSTGGSALSKPESTDRSHRVVGLGYVADGTLRWLYQHAVALVYVPKYEGFGRPVIEAQIEDCRVIAADIAVLREIASRETRWVTPDCVGLECALLEALSDDARGAKDLRMQPSGMSSAANGAHSPYAVAEALGTAIRKLNPSNMA